MKNDKITDYFGFDLGDGESAVAWAHAESDAAPMMLEICGRKSILTALGERDGKALIGEQAYLSEADSLFVRFKSRYLKEPLTVGRLIEKFARAMLAEIEKSGKLSDIHQAMFFIGCPSGWKTEIREGYKKHFENAGFENVGIIPESRAAFMFVRESGELRTPEETLARPTLIIDAGSSTTDFTFVDQLKACDIVDFGENALGGGLIDRLLLERALRAHPKEARLREIFKICPQYEARCELEARKVKEMVFARQTQDGADFYRVPCESSVKIYYDKPPITMDIACDDGVMAALLSQKLARLNGESYDSAYKKSLIGAKGALHTRKPELILLTGGASRMRFMREAAREIFPEATLLTGAEPEFSIARGLCYALRIDRRTDRFESDVRALIDSDAVEDIVRAALPGLFQAITPVIAEEMIKRDAPSAFGQWKRGELKTVGDMNEALSVLMSISLTQGNLKEALEGVTYKWLEGVRPSLERLTDPICAKCHLPPASLSLPTAMAFGAEELRIGTAQMIDLGLIQTVVDVVIASVVAAVLGGGGVALLMAGPVGLVVSFAIGFVASRLGTSLAKKHVDQMNIPIFLRALFSETVFRQTLLKREGELTLSIEAQLREVGSRQTEEMTARVSAAIERQLTEMADKARLLIH